MIIAVDIDGVLNDLIPKTIELYNTRNGTDIRVEDITSYNFVDCLPKQNADEIIELFRERDLWDSLLPAQDSQWGLKLLANEGHEIYLATATLPDNFPWKVEWIQKHFPFIKTDNIIRIKNKGLLKCDVMIDDCLDNLISNMCERIIIDQPWNRDYKREYAYDIQRAYNFHDVVNIIHKMEEKENE